MKIFVSISFIYLIGFNLGCNNSQKHNLNENNIDSYSTQFIELKNNMICIKFLSDSFLFQTGLKESSNYHYNTILQPNCTYNYSVNDFTNQKFDSIILINKNNFGFNNCYILTSDSAYLRLINSNSTKNKYYSVKLKNKNVQYSKFLAHHIMNNWSYKLYQNLNPISQNDYIEIYIKNNNNWHIYTKQLYQTNLFDLYFKIIDKYNSCFDSLRFDYETSN